jgi:hypothetical protein
MTILLAMILGLVASGISFVGGAFLASIAATAAHMSNAESARDYLVVGVGLCSAFLALVGTIILTLRRRGITSVSGVLGGLGGSVAGIVGVAALGIGLYASSQPQMLGRNGAKLRLEFQIQAPQNSPLPEIATTQMQLQTGQSVTDGSWYVDQKELADGRPAQSGSVQLFFRDPRRQLALRLPNHEAQIFRLRLPADPTSLRYKQWSEWQMADLVESPGATAPAQVAPEKAFLIRYQIVTSEQN